MCKLDGEIDPRAAIRDNRDVFVPKKNIESPLQPDQAGPYQCMTWDEELSDFVYSDVLNIDDCKQHLITTLLVFISFVLAVNR